MGSCSGQVNVYSDAPQEVCEGSGLSPQVEHVCIRIAWQHQGVEMPRWRIHPGMPSIVYFHQLTGALHAVRWSNSSLNAYNTFFIFFCQRKYIKKKICIQRETVQKSQISCFLPRCSNTAVRFTQDLHEVFTVWFLGPDDKTLRLSEWVAKINANPVNFYKF